MASNHQPRNPRAADRTPVLVSWSGGKDSCLALHALRQDPAVEVVGLLTSVSDEFGRISHHGVREDVLRAQAEALDLPLTLLRIPTQPDAPCTHEAYAELVGATLQRFVDRGVRHVAHGDLFLADLRRYREEMLARLDMTGVFPIWGMDSTAVVQRLVALGYEATIVCAEAVLGRSFAGRRLDADLLLDLPEGVDPAGENGEYHSFVSAGPVFRQPVPVEAGAIVERDGRFYADLVLAAGANAGPLSAS